MVNNICVRILTLTKNLRLGIIEAEKRRDIGMLFLIDYENVRNAGLRGCEFLQVSDWNIVQYWVLWTLCDNEVRLDGNKEISNRAKECKNDAADNR